MTTADVGVQICSRALSLYGIFGYVFNSRSMLIRQDLGIRPWLFFLHLFVSNLSGDDQIIFTRETLLMFEVDSDSRLFRFLCSSDRQLKTTVHDIYRGLFEVSLKRLVCCKVAGYQFSIWLKKRRSIFICSLCKYGGC